MFKKTKIHSLTFWLMLMSIFLLYAPSFSALTIPDSVKKSGVTISKERVSGSTYNIIVTNEKKRFLSVILQDADTGIVLTPNGSSCGFAFGEIVNPGSLIGSNNIFQPNVQTLVTQVDAAQHKNVKVKVYGPPFSMGLYNNFTHKPEEAPNIIVPAVHSFVFHVVLNAVGLVAVNTADGAYEKCQQQIEAITQELTQKFVLDILGDCNFMNSLQAKINNNDFQGAVDEINKKASDMVVANLEDIVTKIVNALTVCGVTIVGKELVEYATLVGEAASKAMSATELLSAFVDIATTNTYEEFLLQNLPPTVTINVSPQTGYEPLNVNFSLSLIPSDTLISKVEWDFDGDGTIDKTTTTPETSYTYNSKGQYTARVKVTDSDGQTATSETMVGVLAAGDVFTNTYTGYLDSTTISKTHSFTLPLDGELRLTINIDPTLDLRGSNAIQIIGSNGTTVLYHSSGPRGGSDISRSFGPLGLEMGTYYIKVDPLGGYGGYTITTTFNPQPLPIDAEPNHDYLSAKSININTTISGHIGYVGSDGVTDAADMFRFVLPSDGELRLTVNIDSTLSLYGYDKIQITASDGTTVLSHWLGPSGGSDISKSCPPLGLKAGTYYIKLTPYKGYGGYTITTTFNPQPLLIDAEPNHDYLSANSIKINTTISGHIGYLGSDGVTDAADMFKFVLPSDGELRLTVNIDSTLSLSGYDGIQIIGSDGATVLYQWYGPGGGTDISKTFGPLPLKAGTYYIKLNVYKGYGGYTITTTFNPQPLLIDAEPNHDYLSAKSISINTTISGHIGYLGSDGVTDAADMFKFVLPSDGDLVLTINIDSTLNLSGYDKIQIIGSDGTTVLYSWKGPSGGKNTSMSFGPLALKAGTYYIKLNQYKGYGGYTLTTVFGNSNPKIDSFIINPTTGNKPLEVGVLYRVSDINSTDTLTCTIDMDNDGTPEFTVANCRYGTKSFTYQNAGNYTAKLKVTDGNGGLTEKPIAVSVIDPNPSHRLTVTKSGTGSGTVSADDCDLTWSGNTGTCTANSGTTVTLTATPSGGSTFAGWSNGTGPASICKGIRPCSFPLSADASLTAQFNIRGDINRDRKVDISDVILCLRQATGIFEPNSDLGDMNGDFLVDIRDAMIMLRKVANSE